MRWEMDPATDKPLSDVFSAYTDEDHEFSRTRIIVKLSAWSGRWSSWSAGGWVQAVPDGHLPEILSRSSVVILDQPRVAEQRLFRIDSLDELPGLVARHNAG